jgi:membrane-bound lytic murein transglycosylase D
MYGTAKKYGLTIDDYTDERRDPIKSTEAAIKYLNDLHSKFGKWYLAAMAYNCGEGRVAAAITKAGSDDLNALLDEQAKYLPPETRKYIRKVITMAYFAEDTNFLLGNGAGHFLNGGNAQDAFVKKEINGGSSLSDVAEAIDMSLSELWSYNPHLQYFFTPPNKKSYHIYIPYDKERQYERDFNPLKESAKFDVHIVEKGDTFYKIAKKYKVGYKIIKDFNKINSDSVKPGQKLVIPILRPSKNEQTKYYTAKQGDTLYSISVKYKLSVAELKQANNLKGEIIYPGLKLEIPQIR